MCYVCPIKNQTWYHTYCRVVYDHHDIGVLGHHVEHSREVGKLHLQALELLADPPARMLESLDELRPNTRLHFILFAGGPPLSVLQEKTESRQRIITFDPAFDFSARSVSKGIVGGGMMPDTVCHGFNENTTSIRYTSSSCFSCRVIDSEYTA